MKKKNSALRFKIFLLFENLFSDHYNKNRLYIIHYIIYDIYHILLYDIRLPLKVI